MDPCYQLYLCAFGDTEDQDLINLVTGIEIDHFGYSLHDINGLMSGFPNSLLTDLM